MSTESRCVRLTAYTAGSAAFLLLFALMPALTLALAYDRDATLLRQASTHRLSQSQTDPADGTAQITTIDVMTGATNGEGEGSPSSSSASTVGTEPNATTTAAPALPPPPPTATPVPNSQNPNYYPNCNPAEQTGCTITDGGLVRTWPFMGPIMSNTLDHCFNPLVIECLPALNASRESVNAAWLRAHKQCRHDYCECLPDSTTGGIGPNSTCTAVKPTSLAQLCENEQNCASAHERCDLDFLYNDPAVPSACAGFITCSRAPSLAQLSYLQCQQLYLGCPTQATGKAACDYILETETGGGQTVGHIYKGSPMMMVVILTIVLVAIVGTLLSGIISVRRRRQLANRQHVEALLADMIATQTAVTRADPVRWYPMLQRKGRREAGDVDDTDADGEAALRDANEVRPLCVRCHKMVPPVVADGVGERTSTRLLLLPCRCEWCGCGASDVDLRAEAKEAKETEGADDDDGAPKPIAATARPTADGPGDDQEEGDQEEEDRHGVALSADSKQLLDHYTAVFKPEMTEVVHKRKMKRKKPKPQQQQEAAQDGGEGGANAAPADDGEQQTEEEIVEVTVGSPKQAPRCAGCRRGIEDIVDVHRIFVVEMDLASSTDNDDNDEDGSRKSTARGKSSESSPQVSARKHSINGDDDDEGHADEEAKRERAALAAPLLVNQDDDDGASTDNDAAPNKKAEGTGSKRKNKQQKKKLPQCMVCCDDSSCVVLLPCRHLVACVACGRRLGVARAHREGAGEQGQPPGGQLVVSSRCPMCRAEVKGMVLLEEGQVRAAAAASARDV